MNIRVDRKAEVGDKGVTRRNFRGSNLVAAELQADELVTALHL